MPVLEQGHEFDAVPFFTRRTLLRTGFPGGAGSYATAERFAFVIRWIWDLFWLFCFPSSLRSAAQVE